jgi:GT2 family glycosyltransferase
VTAPELAIIVATYQRPRNLGLCLASIARQSIAGSRIEVVVADDGSADETPEVVERFRGAVEFPVQFTSHAHHDFQAGRCRNDGVRVSRAPYLLFVDQDCVLPPDHARVHLGQRRLNAVCGSDAYRLTPTESERLIDHGVIDARPSVSLRERWRVGRDHLDAQVNWLLRNPYRPRLAGCDIGMWRSDFERVNGFDHKFSHWGGDDDDLRLRLRQAGVTIRSIRNLTATWHLWHPPAPTKPARWKDGPNVHYLQRRFRLTSCVDGLVSRRVEDLSIRVRNPQGRESLIAMLGPARPDASASTQRVDVECLFLPGADGFSGHADCNVLILTDHVERPPLREAHILVTDRDDVVWRGGPRLRTAEFARLWEAVR